MPRSTKFAWATILSAVLLSGCGAETTKSAVGACRQMLIERLNYDFEGAVTSRDAEYVLACMNARGFSRNIETSCNAVEMTYAGRCYRRRLRL
jgi:hypothetical protein